MRTFHVCLAAVFFAAAGCGEKRLPGSGVASGSTPKATAQTTVEPEPIPTFGTTKNGKGLKGLSTVKVLVEMIDPEGGKATGLTDARLQTDAELRLRRNGLKVVDDTDEADAVGVLYLNVSLLIDKETGICCFSGDVALQETGLLKRDPSIRVIGAVVWETPGTIGMGPAHQLGDVIRNAVGERVDKFCNAWLKANPKP